MTGTRIPSTRARIEFGDMTLNGTCDLCFDSQGGDTIWGIFWWDMMGDCVVEGDFIALIG